MFSTYSLLACAHDIIKPISNAHPGDQALYNYCLFRVNEGSPVGFHRTRRWIKCTKKMDQVYQDCVDSFTHNYLLHKREHVYQLRKVRDGTMVHTLLGFFCRLGFQASDVPSGLGNSDRFNRKRISQISWQINWLR